MAGQVAGDIVDDPVPGRVLARQNARAIGRAQRNRVERIDEHRPLGGQPIDVRRLDIGMPCRAELIPPEIIDDDNDDVRARGGRGLSRRRGPCSLAGCPVIRGRPVAAAEQDQERQGSVHDSPYSAASRIPVSGRILAFGSIARDDSDSSPDGNEPGTTEGRMPAIRVTRCAVQFPRTRGRTGSVPNRSIRSNSSCRSCGTKRSTWIGSERRVQPRPPGASTVRSPSSAPYLTVRGLPGFRSPVLPCNFA